MSTEDRSKPPDPNHVEDRTYEEWLAEVTQWLGRAMPEGWRTVTAHGFTYAALKVPFTDGREEPWRACRDAHLYEARIRQEAAAAERERLAAVLEEAPYTVHVNGDDHEGTIAAVAAWLRNGGQP